MSSNYSPKADDIVAVRGRVFRSGLGLPLAVAIGTREYENLKDVTVAPWIDPEELRRLRAENESQRETIDFQREREDHFAKALGIPDGGRYRNDWDAALEVVRQIAQHWQQDEGQWRGEMLAIGAAQFVAALDALARLLPEAQG